MTIQKRRLRLGIVGAGLVARQAHLPAALSSERIELTALVDPAPGRAAALARDFGIKALTATSLAEVLPSIEAAVIATPNDSHCQLGLQCIRAGVALLIEKPLCTTLADAELLVAAAEAARVVLAVGYSTRFRDNVVFLKELLDAHEFGPVRRFVHQFGSAGGWAPLSAYNLQRNATGGGVLVVTGTHFLDRMLYFWGYPDSFSLTDDGTAGPEANAVATFGYDRADAQIAGLARYSKAAALPSGLVIEAERGIVKLADTDDAQVLFLPRGSPQLSLNICRRGPPRFDPRVAPFQHQLEDFVDAVQSARPPTVDGKQALASVRLLAGLYAARRIETRHWYSQAALA
ncbi:MAG TPA: Gfo/Idh/MocA family oxidoreductase [Steroidobacteraceae bacterium]|jgi:predicted dehydrogenase|nr:Gfo/Idh/MocA family oxidoreductase [Steroidobacteraceae bacterium]